MDHTTQESTQEIKLCECGCGLPAPIAKQSSTKNGWVRGMPIRFIHGHHARKPIPPTVTRLCECGCGKSFPVSRYPSEQGRRFIHGHNPRDFQLPAVVRFWERAKKRGPDECWEWTGGKNIGGYGQISDKYKSRPAHRFSYELHNGPIPEGLYCLHKCDNPSCVNPAHLFVGTIKDNSDDMWNKGRGIRGTAHPRTKFTEPEIIEIRRRFAQGETQIAIAKEKGVSSRAISSIVNYETWKHVP